MDILGNTVLNGCLSVRDAGQIIVSSSNLPQTLCVDLLLGVSREKLHQPVYYDLSLHLNIGGTPDFLVVRLTGRVQTNRASTTPLGVFTFKSLDRKNEFWFIA